MRRSSCTIRICRSAIGRPALLPRPVKGLVGVVPDPVRLEAVLTPTDVGTRQTGAIMAPRTRFVDPRTGNAEMKIDTGPAIAITTVMASIPAAFTTVPTTVGSIPTAFATMPAPVFDFLDHLRGGRHGRGGCFGDDHRSRGAAGSAKSQSQRKNCGSCKGGYKFSHLISPGLHARIGDLGTRRKYKCPILNLNG